MGVGGLILIGLVIVGIAGLIIGYKLGYHDGQLDQPRKRRGNFRPTSSLHPC